MDFETADTHAATIASPIRKMAAQLERIADSLEVIAAFLKNEQRRAA